jgi:sugar lactone lactonase YvrE
LRAAPGDLYVGEANGTIERFRPDGTQSIFATGMPGPISGLAFDQAGNLFAASRTDNTVYKFAPDGSRTTFASLVGITALAFDSSGVLIASGATTNHSGLLKFSSDGTSTTFISGHTFPADALAFDASGNLFALGRLRSIAYITAWYTPAGISNGFAGTTTGAGLAFDSSGYLFATAGSTISRFAPDGTKTTFASQGNILHGIAFDAQGNLFGADLANFRILEFAPDGTQSTFVVGLTSSPDAIAFQPQVPEPSVSAVIVLGVGTWAFRRRRCRSRQHGSCQAR